MSRVETFTHTQVNDDENYRQHSLQVASEMQTNDPDWRYDVVDCKNGLGRIDVYDEDGVLIHKGFVS